jgi:hypothetical protein
MLSEIQYWLLSKPYFFVNVISNGRIIKKFIQPATSDEQGFESFLINKSLKAAWFKPEKPFIDKLKFVTFVKIDNAIPLIIKKEVVYNEKNKFVNREIVLDIIKEDEDKAKRKKVLKDMGLEIEFVEISFPPTLLLQKIEAHFVKETLSQPTTNLEALKWVFIVGLIVAGFLIWTYVSKSPDAKPLGV